MRHRFHNSLRTVSILGLAAFGLIGQASIKGVQAADPSLYFYPKSAWQLSKPAPQRCELKNSFDNGFVMYVSGSNPGQDNVDYIAVDFMQSLFGDGQSYPVQITVPGLGSHTIQAVAESSRVLQIGLRGQGGLFGGIESTGAFDLKIDQNEFRFYMTGINDAVKKFETCTNGLSERPALASATVPSKPVLHKPAYEPFENDRKQGVVPVQEILPEPAMKRAIEVDLSSPPFGGPTSGGSSARVELSKTEETKPVSDERFYMERMRKNAYGGMKSEGSATISQDIMRDEAAGVGIAPIPVSEKLPAADLLPIERVEAVSSMPEPARADYNREKIVAKADFTQEEPASKDPNAPFSGSFERISTDKSSSRKVTPRETSLDLPPLSGSSLDVSNGAAMNQKVSELMREVQELQARNEALKSELDNSYKASEKERMSISSENWNLERATMQYNEAERQIAALGRQLNRQKIQCESQKKELEAMLFDPKLTQDAQIAELARLEAENARYKAQISELQARIGTQ